MLTALAGLARNWRLALAGALLAVVFAHVLHDRTIVGQRDAARTALAAEQAAHRQTIDFYTAAAAVAARRDEANTDQLVALIAWSKAQAAVPVSNDDAEAGEVKRQGKFCPVKGCDAHAKPNQLMCWPHWRRVPKPLNRAVFDTCADASGRELGGEALRDASARYRQARDAAIAAVEAKEAAE